MATKPQRAKRPPGRPPGRTFGFPVYEVRLRPETVKVTRLLAAVMGEEWKEIIDEMLRVGAAYIYTRRRQNLADSIPEIPEVWEKLPALHELDVLKNTEYPAMEVRKKR